jgi:nucleoside-diphosphate-sugar epimerase
MISPQAFRDLTALVAKEAHRQGFIQSPAAEKVIDPADGDEITPHAAILLGTNAKLVESRARRDLGWQPTGPSLEDEIADIVKCEAKDLGLKDAL